MADSNSPVPQNAHSALTRSDVAEVMQDAQDLGIADLARKEGPNMLDVLVKIAKREVPKTEKGKPQEDPPPWSVAKSAAKDVIEIGEGRPSTKEPQKGDGNLYITINQLFGGESRQKVIENAGVDESVSATIPIGGARTNLAEDLIEIVPVMRKPSPE